ncbi:MAG: hypothetical protein KBI42_12890, partial [Bacteroidia bacterium]|nr:hypothetical protein [Bacteroidia bacterium]
PYYLKSAPDYKGTVYVVNGVGGQGGNVKTQGDWPHKAMYSYSKSHHGSMIIDVNKDTLSAIFLTSTDTIFDRFKIVKSDKIKKKNSTKEGFNQNQIKQDDKTDLGFIPIRKEDDYFTLEK